MVAQVTQPIKPQMPVSPALRPQLIEAQEIKAILYLGLRGDISLPIETHKVDIFI